MRRNLTTKSNFFFRAFFYLLPSIFYLLASPSVYACPLCKEALTKMGEVWAAIGFNLSIYVMMAVPFILVGTFGLALYFNYRKHYRP